MGEIIQRNFKGIQTGGATVTSRSGALRTLIIWGHLLASALDFYDVRPFIFDYDVIDIWHDVLLFDVDRCYWLSFIECAGIWPWGCRGIGRTPLDSRLSQGVCFWVICLLWCFIQFDDLLLTFLTWLLLMQADDSLSTRLTYGVKGPHMICREVEGEGWTTALPPPTSTPTVAQTVG